MAILNPIVIVNQGLPILPENEHVILSSYVPKWLTEYALDFGSLHY